MQKSKKAKKQKSEEGVQYSERVVDELFNLRNAEISFMQSWFANLSIITRYGCFRVDLPGLCSRQFYVCTFSSPGLITHRLTKRFKSTVIAGERS